MVMRASQVGVLALALCACEAPARSKPWRHAADPTASEGQGAVASGSVTAASPPPVAGPHVLRIQVDSDPGRLTPVVEPSLWARRITLGTVFEPLIRYAPPEGSTPAGYQPRLARSWHVTPDGMAIELELEPDVTFHDGRPMTSSDVQFTIDAVRDAKKGIDHLRALLGDVDAVELTGPHSVHIRLKKPNGWVLRALAEIPILPMHIYDGSLWAGGALVGTGPWKLASNKQGVIHLARYDHYWGPKPAIADVEFEVQLDAAVALTEAKRGEIDVVPALIPAHWPEQAAAPGLAAFHALQLAPPRLRYLAFNYDCAPPCGGAARSGKAGLIDTARAPLDDARVRHALALLVDRRAIAKRVFGGLQRPALWPVWPGGPVDAAETAVPEFDPAAAGKLLDAAGWSDHDKDGIRDRDGQQLRLVMIASERAAPADPSSPAPKTERDYFVEACKRAGVVVELKTGGEAWLARRAGDHAFDVVEEEWDGMVDSDLSPVLGGASPGIDHVLQEMAGEWDPSRRAALGGELEAALAEAWPIAGIVADAPQGLVHRHVQGVHVWDGWIDLARLALAE
jgi:peptide/nickel transport system substrate-binding protein